MSLRPVSPAPAAPASPAAWRTQIRRHWRAASGAALDLLTSHAMIAEGMFRHRAYTTDDLRRWREKVAEARDALDRIDHELMAIIEIAERMDDGS